MKSPVFTAALAWAALAPFAPGARAETSARHSSFAPDARPESIRERLDYAACRKKILLRAKKGGDAQDAKTKAGLAQCQEEYPAASLFVECKKTALAKHARDAARLQEALGICRKRFDELNFDPASPVPFRVAGGRAYFGGAGLNMARKIDAGFARKTEEGDAAEDNPNDFGNFTCEVAEAVVRGKQEPEYVLFGNQPQAFAGMAAVTDEDVRQRFKVKSGDLSDDFFVDVDGGLRLYGTAKKGLTAYFPVSYCYFNRRLGKIFQGLKVYYLVDKAKKSLTPYFGIAFYRGKKDKVAVKDILGPLKEAMGPEYREVTRRKGAVILSRAPLTSFDAEGDPRNVCKEPRDNDFIALLKTDEAEKSAEYLILSNVGNLCKYGDRIVGRLYRK